MKIENIDNPIKVNFQKSNIPIIFLDSNMIIELNKVINNTSTIKYKAEVEKTLSILLELSEQNKLLIPYADQEEEIDYRQGKSNNIDILFKLSNGNYFKNYLRIQEEQIETLFKAFLNNNDKIKIDYNLGFEKITNTAKDANVFIKGKLYLLGKNIIQQIQDTKNFLVADLADYQKELLPTESYKEHLFKELTYEGHKLSNQILHKSQSQQPLNDLEREHWERFIDLSQKFKLQGDLSCQYITYCKFLLGYYWFAVPFVDIERNIRTYISLNQKFKRGDYQDTINASCYLPYCNYYFTDNAMRKMLINIGIDKKYNVKLYSFENIHEMNLELSKL
ncbi:MAG: hypothetical protein IJX00_01965 [Clostridia bacterium]|nr:hypothetical protein [Clostridia bacterium]